MLSIAGFGADRTASFLYAGDHSVCVANTPWVAFFAIDENRILANGIRRGYSVQSVGFTAKKT